MLQSMTGIGRAEALVGSRHLSIEIRSLNGKVLDLNLNRLSPVLRSWEMELRSFLSNKLLRGTIELIVGIRQENQVRKTTVNRALATAYFKELKNLAESLGVEPAAPELLACTLRLPEVLGNDEPEPVTTQEWEEIKKHIDRAVEQLWEHRRIEGVALEADLRNRIQAIEDGVDGIIPLEAVRIERIKTRLKTNLNEAGLESKDPNRFEQELIYYLEKMDISEEKTRLLQHCRYFREVLQQSGPTKGKVLGFILQEIGREINTTGSKANDAGIQQIVVHMKDELEKAKEQVLNVL